MNNLVSNWIEIASDKYGSLSAGVKFANMVCNLKMQPGTPHDMKQGKKNVPNDFQGIMVSDSLWTLMEKAGYDVKQGDYDKLLESLTLPRRIKK